MMRQPASIVFDVNETLSDLRGVGDAFELAGAGRAMASTWFASVLRDGFALTAAGSDASFASIAEGDARILLGSVDLRMDVDRAVDTVMAAFAEAPPHPDVAAGLHALHEAGHHLFTLSNGPTSTARRLLEHAGALDIVDELLTVEGRSPWKPARSAYTEAMARIGGDRPAYLAAVHPWDVHGASRAGMSTIWVDRSGGGFPAHFAPPTITVADLGEIALHV